MVAEVASLTFLAQKNMDFKRFLTKGIKHKRINQKEQDPVFKSNISRFNYKCVYFKEEDQKIVD